MKNKKKTCWIIIQNTYLSTWIWNLKTSDLTSDVVTQIIIMIYCIFMSLLSALTNKQKQETQEDSIAE